MWDVAGRNRSNLIVFTLFYVLVVNCRHSCLASLVRPAPMHYVVVVVSMNEFDMCYVFLLCIMLVSAGKSFLPNHMAASN